ncbi:GrpB family protein [Fodinicola feengrottensis]|uniref:GrpB family protein n=1 Tax=Fodinicola feengrottensis TaxID=435914 RepID=A0ABP4T6W5_9ACTN|nr:GrpB family protein [Fodinicola feengrottensis]
MITVVDYDPAWPPRFEVLRQEYARAMAAADVPVVAIEHVGSTSVPGLAAKPVIDCDIIVAPADVEAASAVLVGLGFRPLGELGIPRRWAFKEPARLAGTNTYVIVEGALSLRNHLCVRDVLRSNAALREEYAAVKLRVAATAANIDEYGRGKNATIQRILAAGGMNDAERASIDANLVPSHETLPRSYGSPSEQYDDKQSAEKDHRDHG